MANDLSTIDQATDFSKLCSTPSVQEVLSRAFDSTATFTAGEIAAVEQVAACVPALRPVDERMIRQSIGTLAAALPAQATDEAAGKLKLGAYQTMLAGYDERAFAYACRRCLAELDWFPTVHQLIERMQAWVSPEHAAVARARAILRSGRRVAAGDDQEAVTAEDMREVRERSAAAAESLSASRPAPVPFDTKALEPHQIRIPNKGDYERLFGIDAESIAARAEAARREDEETGADLLRDAYELHVQLYRAA